MVETWADREDFEGRPADNIECPCCGRQVAADMVVKLPTAPAPAQEAMLSARGVPWSEYPEYACSGELSRVHREGVAPSGFPGNV